MQRTPLQPLTVPVERLDAQAARARLALVVERLLVIRGSSEQGRLPMARERPQLHLEKLALEKRLAALNAESRARAAAEQAARPKVERPKTPSQAERDRRAFAGLVTPLYEACVELLPPAQVAALEALALDLQAVIEQRAAERRAAKAARKAALQNGPRANGRPVKTLAYGGAQTGEVSGGCAGGG
jgi:hypothetical protein